MRKSFYLKRLYLIENEELIPKSSPEHGAPVFGRHDQSTESAGSGQPGTLEVAVIDREMLFENAAFVFGETVQRSEQIFGVVSEINVSIYFAKSISTS